MDVFIIQEFRKKGLSKLLLAEVVAHPQLQRWGLGTADTHGLYERFGFRNLSNPEMLMEINLGDRFLF